MNLEEARKLAEEAAEGYWTEEEVSHLADNVLELADEVERLREVEREATKMLSEYELNDARVISSVRLEKMREALYVLTRTQQEVE